MWRRHSCLQRPDSSGRGSRRVSTLQAEACATFAAHPAPQAYKSMKITFISGVFPPEREPSGVMADQLAARFARDGHEVTAIAPFPSRPGGELYPGFHRRLRSASSESGGYRLIRCANWFVGKQRRNIDRLLENITFGLSSAWATWRAGRPDVMIVETWPLFAVQFPALLAAWWRVPFLYYIKDVYPEAAEKAGILTNDGW